MIRGVDHVHLVCRDIDEAIDFYTNVLGFRFLRRVQIQQPESVLEVAFLGVGDMLIELFPVRAGEEVPEANRSPFGVMVDDMDKTIAELTAKGIEVHSQRIGWTFSGRYAAIKDPSGVTIELREWFKDDGPYNEDWKPSQPNVTRLA